MKSFLTQQLRELEARTGIRQMYFLNQKPDALSQVNILIDAMLEVCAEYTYLTDEVKKALISRGIKEDKEFDSLNARTIRAWFDLYGGKYFEAGMTYEVTDPGPISEETQRLINQFQASLSQGPKEVPTVSRYEVLKAKERLKTVSKPYPSSTEEDYRLYNLKLEYAKKYYHPHTGKKLDNWITFEAYLKQV